MSEKRNGTVRALGLCSGGLDSILAGLVLRAQGIEVTWVSFETPFFDAEKSRDASQKYDVPLIVADITEDYILLLKNPPAGFGQHMNPCLDCHTLMFQKAGAILAEKGFDFLFSGEVAGQRPMSQTKSSLRYVEKRSGYDGFILRPLSAQALQETPMEKDGLVDRDRLYGFTGRSRKPQMALAELFGVENYPSPAGGCLLTDGGFSRRLRDLMDHDPLARVADYHFLKVGRHFRLDHAAKLVVGRNREDNQGILALVDPAQDFVFRITDRPGPVAVMPKGCGADAVSTAASICAAYARKTDSPEVTVSLTGAGGRKEIRVSRLPADTFAAQMIG